MLYQLSYASQMYRKPVAWDATERGTQPPAAITAQTIRLAQGPARGKPALIGQEQVTGLPRITAATGSVPGQIQTSPGLRPCFRSHKAAINASTSSQVL